MKMNEFLYHVEYIMRAGSLPRKMMGTRAALWPLRQVAALNKCYYAYPGSLTTEPYSETVTFLIFPNPITISHSQVCIILNM